MLATILQSLFIDPSWVAEEYLRWSKAGKWKKENTIESFKCSFNLEQILDSKMYYGMDELDDTTEEDYMKFGETEGNTTDN
jgi:hypothetical protein